MNEEMSEKNSYTVRGKIAREREKMERYTAGETCLEDICIHTHLRTYTLYRVYIEDKGEERRSETENNTITFKGQ